MNGQIRTRLHIFHMVSPKKSLTLSLRSTRPMVNSAVPHPLPEKKTFVQNGTGGQAYHAIHFHFLALALLSWSMCFCR